MLTYPNIPFKKIAKGIFLFLILGYFSDLYLDKRALYLQGGNVVYKAGEVLGIQSVNTTMEADYGQQTAVGKPEIFGAAHGPSLSHLTAWDMLKDIKVTTMRRDINLQFEAPPSLTVNQYREMNLDKDYIDNFNMERVNETRQIFKNARERGMKTMAVTAYMPLWLSRNGKASGLPSSWEVYEDLIKKLYKIHRPYLDYIEVSNEPDLNSFLDPMGTGFSKQEAYRLLFIHTSRALREVDAEINDGKQIKIGGGVTSYPYQPSYIEALLKDSEAKGYLSFVSYHTYGTTEPTSGQIKNILNKYQKSELPIFITEWNKSSKTTEYNPYHNTALAISYTGGKLIEFLNMGYAGANYFSMAQSDSSRPNTVFSVFGIYEMLGDKLISFPQTKTWTVLSNKSKLGRGESAIYKVSYDSSTQLRALAFKNSEGKYGIAINNPTSTSYIITATLKNIDPSKRTKMVAYEASAIWNASLPKGSLVTNFATQDKVQIFVSPMTLVSIVME